MGLPSQVVLMCLKNCLNHLKLVKPSKFLNWVYLGIFGVGLVWCSDVLF